VCSLHIAVTYLYLGSSLPEPLRRLGSSTSLQWKTSPGRLVRYLTPHCTKVPNGMFGLGIFRLQHTGGKLRIISSLPTKYYLVGNCIGIYLCRSDTQLRCADGPVFRGPATGFAMASSGDTPGRRECLKQVREENPMCLPSCSIQPQVVVLIS